MITKEEKKTIQVISKKYHAKRVLLFGSSVSDNGNDIDLAIEGVEPKVFDLFQTEINQKLNVGS